MLANVRDSLRQLLHVSFKVAAKKGDRYLNALKKHEAVIARNVTENLFDRHLKPLLLALDAYHKSLNGQPAPVIDGLTGEQRFYMGFGQVWRSKIRDAQQIVYLKTDPHSPDQFRANGTVRNQPGFYEAFGVKPGDKLYRAPAERVKVW